MSPQNLTTRIARTRERAHTGAGLLQAYPTLRQAAKMIGVTPSTLSRRNLPCEHAGREKRLDPRTILEQAAYYRKRDEYEVGGALVEYALEHAGQYVAEVEAQVDAFLSETSDREAPLDAANFLEEAQRNLPPELYKQVELAYRSGR
jgi:hypothetical protein